MSNYLDHFKPYIKKHKISSNGELTGLCPLHDDSKNSFSLNTDTGLWICYAGCGKGNANQLSKLLEIDPPEKNYIETKPVDQSVVHKRDQFHKYFIDHFDTLNIYNWSKEIIERTKVGYDPNNKTYTFPITDLNNNLINLRWHKKHQIAGVRGSHWFPSQLLMDTTDNSFVVWSEGEKDALTLLSQNIPGITNTNGVGLVPKDITPISRFERIYICFDPDIPGIKGSRKVIDELKRLLPTKSISVCQMPGVDITDWFNEN